MFEYLIHYLHNDGQGRCFVGLEKPIKHQDDIFEIDKYIENNFGRKKVGVCAYTLVRKYSK